MGLVWVAVVLGLVEGLTEFLPVSSTGHLIVAGRLLGFTGERAATFEIFIQLGAILAVVVLERERFVGLLRPDPQRRFSGLRGIVLLFLTTLPALVAGAFLHGTIKSRLFGPGTVAIGLFVGGIALLLVERFRPAARVDGVDALEGREAFLVGLFQCLALWPGVSRSGATIAGGLLCGLERRTAATYSFLAAVPTMCAATLFDLYKSAGTLTSADVVPFAVGFVVSFVAAWAAVRGFMALIGRLTLAPFAWYRIAVAPLVWLFVR
ncbi:MAG TPA: undecaprenyl-diphosphate phosphatase [Candidatus Polarisedimenticolia bacterium]|nr:undecaprenyl-diphosphate phosphatase [Candidatus Polarisedimenticolia bacterium]